MGDDSLVELVMNSLLGRLVDNSHVVRQMCIRGLGNIACIGKTQVRLNRKIQDKLLFDKQ